MMNSDRTNLKIARFLSRKDAQFPELELLERRETRTIKFPLPRRVVHAAHA